MSTLLAAAIAFALQAGPAQSASPKGRTNPAQSVRCRTSFIDRAGKHRHLNGNILFGETAFISKRGRLLFDGASFVFDGHPPAEVITLPPTDVEEKDNVILLFEGREITPVASNWKHTRRATFDVTFSYSRPETAPRLNWTAKCRQAAS